ncbi:MAG: hypothetical protein ACRDJ9_32760, partial [Dehalococcoidia bacterium]
MPLRDGSTRSPLFRAACSNANCPQNRSRSATWRAKAAALVASGGAKAAAPRSASSFRQRRSSPSP